MAEGLEPFEGYVFEIGHAERSGSRKGHPLSWGAFPDRPHRGTTSFDHLVGYCEQAGRNGEVERPRRLQVDDELEFGRLLDGQALLALENATDIDADSAPYVREVLAVGHEATNFCVLPYRKNGRNGKSSRQRR